jgi:PHR domain/BTB And C-terminal Kelch
MVFDVLYRFIYCEFADVSCDTALALLYAAKKYLLLDLVEQCRKFLQDNLTSESVSSILDLGLAFDEPDLISRCLDFISEHAYEVFSTEGFLNMTSTALEAVVRLDVLSATEQLMYDSCIAWARHNCLPESSPSDTQIREALGSLVYGIRFPSMDPVEFTRLVMRSDVLSQDEKLAVYYFYHTRDIDSSNSGSTPSFKLPFNLQSRKPHETVVSRFSNVSASEWPTAGKTDTIDFTVDHDVVLIGVGLYGSTPGTIHEVAIEVWMGKILLCIAAKKFETPSCAEPVKIYLGQRVKIRANVTNTIVTTIKGPSTRYGVGGRSRVVSGNTVFTFTASSKCGGRTAVEVGQIPQLFFHTMLTDMALGFSKDLSCTEVLFGVDSSCFPVKKN